MQKMPSLKYQNTVFWKGYFNKLSILRLTTNNIDNKDKRYGMNLTVDPGADVKVGDTWNFFIVKSVRGGQGE